jgi:hypothetical protein
VNCIMWLADLKSYTLVQQKFSQLYQVQIHDALCKAMMEDTALHHVPVGIVFQLDGTPPHISHCVLAILDREFPDHWTGRGGFIS